MQQKRRDFFMWPDAMEGEEGFQRTRCKGPESSFCGDQQATERFYMKSDL